MSDEYNKKANDTQKSIDVLRKDIRFRQEQAKRGQTTYQLDAQIKGSLKQLESLLYILEKDVKSFQENPKDYGISNKQLQKRTQKYDKLKLQYQSLKRVNETFFEEKVRAQNLYNNRDEDNPKVQYNKMNSEQLKDQKKKLQQNQEKAVDDLIDTVQRMKNGGKNIDQEVDQQDKLLDQMGNQMDQNTEDMGKIRRKMVKFMQESSYFCLIAIIVIQVVSLILILVLWH